MTDRFAVPPVRHEADAVLVQASRVLSAADVRLLDGRIETWPDLGGGLAVALVGRVLQRDVEVERDEVRLEATATASLPAVSGPATWVDHWKRDVGLPTWEVLTRRPATRLGRWVRRRTRPAVRWTQYQEARSKVSIERTVVDFPVRYDRRICPHGQIEPRGRHAEWLTFGGDVRT